MRSSVESLSRQEKVVLRLVQPGFEIKVIARELGISPDTVKVHLRHCRVKLDVSSSVTAARLLAEDEGRAFPAGVTPARVMAGWTQTVEDAGTTWGSDAPSVPDVVREAPASASFDFDLRPKDAPEPKGKRHDLTPLQRLALIVAIVVGLMLAIVAAPAMQDSFQRVANAIDPPR